MKRKVIGNELINKALFIDEKYGYATLETYEAKEWRILMGLSKVKETKRGWTGWTTQLTGRPVKLFFPRPDWNYLHMQ